METRTFHSATLELVNTCRALRDFDTLQIVHYLLDEPILTCGYARMNFGSTDKWAQASREQAKGVKYLAIDSLKKAKVEFREGEGRKVMVRVVELRPCHPLAGYHLSSVKAKEFEV